MRTREREIKREIGSTKGELITGLNSFKDKIPTGVLFLHP